LFVALVSPLLAALFVLELVDAFALPDSGVFAFCSISFT
jgi:hypothetical protein